MHGMQSACKHAALAVTPAYTLELARARTRACFFERKIGKLARTLQVHCTWNNEQESWGKASALS
jgi:hypothetical protein